MKWQIAPPDHLPWLARRAKLSIGPNLRALEVIDDTGSIRGMVGLDVGVPNSVAFHIALDSPIALRRVMREAFALAFQGLGKQVATCIVIGSNARSRRLVEHLGFRLVFTGRDYWAPGEDMLLYEMRREECRLLNPAASQGETVHEEAA